MKCIFLLLTLLILGTATLCGATPNQAGLGPMEQRQSRTMLQDGAIVQRADINGLPHVVRQIGNVIALYNQDDHLVIMAQSAQEKPSPSPVELLDSPVLRTEQYQVDGAEFTLQIRGVMGEWAILVLMDTKRRIIFTMSAPAGWVHPRSLT